MIRSLSEDDDWTFGRHRTGQEEIAQNLKTRLLSFKNDWFLDNEANIDWWSLLGTKNNEQIIINEVTRVTLDTDGVVSINSLDTTLKNRNITISVAVTTIYGEITTEFDNGI